jgi:YegS/Rv2252/BmrU family lipid kinase
MLWRQRLHQRVAAAQQVWGRIEPALRLPFFALTTAIAPTRVGLTLDDYEYSPPSTARARIVANPTSGGAHSDAALRELAETARWLTERGLPTELRLTRDAGHATELAREAAVAGLEMVIAAGGDGTVNDVIQALAGYRTALGVLPTGTVNVWAREMGIGLNAVDAREILLYGARRRVDLGRAGQRYFLMMAGIGFDAEVARRVEQGRLKRFGLKLLEYLGAVLLLSVTHRPSSIRITMGQHKRHQQALMVIIGNTRLYGGALTFTRRAVADDGTLDVVVIGSGGMFHRISVIGRALLRLPAAGPRVRYERAQMLRLESKRPTLVQVDGEVIGYLPMTFSVAPQALSVIVPRDAPAGLFGRAPESASLNR